MWAVPLPPPCWSPRWLLLGVPRGRGLSRSPLSAPAPSIPTTASWPPQIVMVTARQALRCPKGSHHSSASCGAEAGRLNRAPAQADGGDQGCCASRSPEHPDLSRNTPASAPGQQWHPCSCLAPTLQHRDQLLSAH